MVFRCRGRGLGFADNRLVDPIYRLRTQGCCFWPPQQHLELLQHHLHILLQYRKLAEVFLNQAQFRLYLAVDGLHSFLHRVQADLHFLSCHLQVGDALIPICYDLILYKGNDCIIATKKEDNS
ncbi:hypothetical protein TorRG33x02_118950 [Trema orientale]|uniref:Uncharacterized protein n=1 Tax=Trema orientale TaxID=63057 RepID=A0A2P5F393_TREOI|nr:hypothetical protein TorRG33x02_118950 [Trema orientale]